MLYEVIKGWTENGGYEWDRERHVFVKVKVGRRWEGCGGGEGCWDGVGVLRGGLLMVCMSRDFLSRQCSACGTLEVRL